MKAMHDRREFLAASAAICSASLLGRGVSQAAVEVSPKVEKGIAWFNVKDWGVEGKGWNDTARFFDRLPSKAEKSVRDAVWGLSRHSAGMLVRFETNSSTIHARYRLLSSRLAMSHMPATGVSGLDLYAQDERGVDRWLAVARPSQQDVNVALAQRIDPPQGRRRYSIYLPLYNGVDALEIGVADKSEFQPLEPRQAKPLVFYGTSIMHGACASRPGMAIPAILGRRLGRPTINLGFSGNGRMEKEVGALLAELDPFIYAIDCLPNMSGATVAQRAEPLVRQLRAARPTTPILLVEDRTYTNARFRKAARERHAASRAALRQAFDKLRADGVEHLHYLAGEELLGDDGEAATDGSHPSDLGMVRYADAYEPLLRKIVGSNRRGKS